MIGKILFLVATTAAFLSLAQHARSGDTPADRRGEARRQAELGNYKDAAALFGGLAVDPANTPKDAAGDLAAAAENLARLEGQEQTEKLLADAEKAWPDSWRVLAAIATLRTQLPPMVRLVGDQYLRQPYWGGDNLNAQARDRAIALRLMLRAEGLLDADARDPADDADRLAFYRRFVDLLLLNRERASWRLTALSDLDELPDYQTYGEFYGGDNRNAPVDADGNPVYYAMPASWEAAKNDGERWRWLLGRMARYGDGKYEADWLMASFLFDQLGVHTMGQRFPVPGESEAEAGTGAFAVRTLGDNETIARLATGVRRFPLPDEFNYLTILKRLSEAPSGEYRGRADALLAQIFENRQQYPKALASWRKAAAEAGGDSARAAQNAIARITGKNGMLEAGPVEPAGTPSSIAYLYRNGTAVTLTAHRLEEKLLLADIRADIKAGKHADSPAHYRPEWIGRTVVESDKTKYLGPKVAEWQVALDPPADHRSARARIELPFADAGCYLVEAKMADGNVSRVILWISNLSLAAKTAGEYQINYVADAVGGEPIANATVTFFGYQAEYRDNNRVEMKVDEFALHTDENGLIVQDAKRFHNRQWLTVAQTDDGRLAYLGFDSVWTGALRDGSGESLSAFLITDRPVYRPNQTVNFKLWLGRPAYGEKPSTPDLAGRTLDVKIVNPMGEVVYDKKLTTDAYGGVADSIVLDGSAPLGNYQVSAGNIRGGGGFRLEEYKKPEYEVTVKTPDKAIRLGDDAEATVKAAYYFGAPVTDARVSYKIVRSTFRNEWFPPWRWDWLYGSGRWCATYRYAWFPGWDDWGVTPPLPPWYPRPYTQPELVGEGEGVLDADGIFRLPISTAEAKEIFGNQDHEYTISVEVMDKSRRTITGEGRIVASRKPYSVTVWADRGYYHAGQEINARVVARLPLGGGVKATGKAVLHRVSYDAAGTPSETEAQSWDVETDADGAATLRLKADKPGQYRLACTLADADGNAVEGAAVLTIRGEPGQGDFRFAGLELVPDRRDYRPGDTMRLAVNAENKDAVVIFLPRAERNGNADPTRLAEAPKPALLRLDNGSQIVDLTIGRSDQPNFFCEALTVHQGRLYVETREIFVPPADKTLQVEVTADRDSYLPGAKARFDVAVTDADGKPAAGQCVVSVYDKSVEYISGGSNVGDIRARFWKWTRSYRAGYQGSLQRHGYRVMKPDDVQWEPLGIFGSREADWNDDMVHLNGAMPTAAGPAGGMRPSTRRMASMASGDAMMMKAELAEAPAAAPPPAQYAGDAGGGQAMQEPAIRSEFADTALWLAALETDADGRASFVVDMPENLTAWKARTWVMGGGTRVGEGERTVETKKNVIVRPQTPRFLTQKDRVVLSANLHNYLPRAKTARVELVLEGGLLEAAPGVELTRTVELAADNGEARVDWLVAALRPGEARVVMKLLTDEESDAAAVAFPVVVHGARRIESFGGVLRGDENETAIAFRVPEERLPDQSRLVFSFSPSIASAMLDALPFLVDYPYGCTEQTLNRFLPAVMARRYLERLGVDLAAAKKKLEDAPTDPASEEWKNRYGDARAKHRPSPVFDDAQLAAMVRQGVERLVAMQNADGGWGWFSGAGERSWPHTTAVIMHGLLAARDNGLAIPPAAIDQGLAWLKNYRDGELEKLQRFAADPEGKKDKDGAGAGRKAKADNLDAFVHLILTARGAGSAPMRDFLYRDRLDLSLAGLSMLGIALHQENPTNHREDKNLAVVLRNLAQFVEENPEIGTAWLNTPSAGWWWWYNDEVETQAWYLKLLARTDPSGERTSGVAKYLLKNRKNGSYWRSTRDTAYAIEALAEYAVASGESEPDMTVAVFLDGERVMERRLTKANLLDDNRFVLEGLAVEAGDHEIRVVRTGAGNLYYGGGLDVFSLEDPIAKAGLDLKVERTYYKLVRETATADMPSAGGTAVAAGVEKYRRERIPSPFDGEAGEGVKLEPGDLVEVELVVEAANDYEYLVFEDMKAAGCEAVELRSGYARNSMGAYIEYRDQKVALFVRHLPRGKYAISYRLRAEIPGRFSALPTLGGGMYATELFANSDEMKLRIVEEGVFE